MTNVSMADMRPGDVVRYVISPKPGAVDTARRVQDWLVFWNLVGSTQPEKPPFICKGRFQRWPVMTVSRFVPGHDILAILLGDYVPPEERLPDHEREKWEFEAGGRIGYFSDNRDLSNAYKTNLSIIESGSSCRISLIKVGQAFILEDQIMVASRDDGHVTLSGWMIPKEAIPGETMVEPVDLVPAFA